MGLRIAKTAGTTSKGDGYYDPREETRKRLWGGGDEEGE
jgi:hypothetical protein